MILQTIRKNLRNSPQTYDFSNPTWLTTTSPLTKALELADDHIKSASEGFVYLKKNDS